MTLFHAHMADEFGSVAHMPIEADTLIEADASLINWINQYEHPFTQATVGFADWSNLPTRSVWEMVMSAGIEGWLIDPATSGTPEVSLPNGRHEIPESWVEDADSWGEDHPIFILSVDWNDAWPCCEVSRFDHCQC
jgi:hypothetical protein